MIPRLSQDYLSQVPSAIKKPLENPFNVSAILHFGAGGFHRSHQAAYFQQLLDKDPVRFSSWSIVGACILPQDKTLGEKMKQKDFLYAVKSSSSYGKEEVRIISSITNVFFDLGESEKIIDKIASEETRIVSFTITEGGYMLDVAIEKFEMDHHDIILDHNGEGFPMIIFGYLLVPKKCKSSSCQKLSRKWLMQRISKKLA